MLFGEVAELSNGPRVHVESKLETAGHVVDGKRIRFAIGPELYSGFHRMRAYDFVDGRDDRVNIIRPEFDVLRRTLIVGCGRP